MRSIRRLQGRAFRASSQLAFQLAETIAAGVLNCLAIKALFLIKEILNAFLLCVPSDIIELRARMSGRLAFSSFESSLAANQTNIHA